MNVATSNRESKLAIIEEANPILQSFNNRSSFHLFGDRLHFVCSAGSKAIVLTRNGDELGIDYYRFGLSGIGSQAVAQLVRWIRGQTRKSLWAWGYWTRPMIGLGNGETMRLLEESSYGDPELTACVLCGSTDYRSIDWWSGRNAKVVGPCCTFGACREPAKAEGDSSR